MKCQSTRGKRCVRAQGCARYVWLHLLTPEIIDNACNDDLIQSDEACGELVIQATRVLQLPQGERQQLARQRQKMGHVLMMVGGFTRERRKEG